MLHAAQTTTLVTELTSAWWIAIVAFTSPLLASLTRNKIPDVVWMLLLGMLIGPSLLAKATLTPGVEFIRELGLGLLFLMAGLEIDQEDVRSANGRRAALTWTFSLALAIALAYYIVKQDFVHAAVFGIAGTSTALGSLLPILKNAGLMDTPLGKAAMRHGAIGELGPILAMTLLLSIRSPWQSALVLLAFFLISCVVVGIPKRFLQNCRWLQRVFISGARTTMQTPLRLTMAVLLSLMLLSALLDIDVVLGALVAGLLIARSMPDQMLHVFTDKIQILGFSFLIPVFFVTSGMGIDAGVVAAYWPAVLLAALAIFLVRGLPVVVGKYELLPRFVDRLLRRDQGTEVELKGFRDKLALGLYSATGLPIIVAVTEVACESELISESMASVLVAAGALTVLLFPLLAQLVQKAHVPHRPHLPHLPHLPHWWHSGEGDEKK